MITQADAKAYMYAISPLRRVHRFRDIQVNLFFAFIGIGSAAHSIYLPSTVTIAVSQDRRTNHEYPLYPFR